MCTYPPSHGATACRHGQTTVQLRGSRARSCGTITHRQVCESKCTDRGARGDDHVSHRNVDGKRLIQTPWTSAGHRRANPETHWSISRPLVVVAAQSTCHRRSNRTTLPLRSTTCTGWWFAACCRRVSWTWRQSSPMCSPCSPASSASQNIRETGRNFDEQ
jgi:hypothetical protein